MRTGSDESFVSSDQNSGCFISRGLMGIIVIVLPIVIWGFPAVPAIVKGLFFLMDIMESDKGSEEYSQIFDLCGPRRWCFFFFVRGNQKQQKEV